MRVILTGSGGLLGSAFKQDLSGHDVLTFGRLQLEQSRSLVSAVVAAAPDLVINCAAHTDLEAAERDPDPCYRANAVLPGLLATACRRVNARLVHLSSTGCYGAWKDEPYTDYDEVRPTTTHHRAKIAGEQAVRDSGCDHTIIRTGWLFGGSTDQPKNFVWRRLLDAKSRESMMSDAAQRGNPTYVGDVSRQTLSLVDAGVGGTFNVVSQGSASRFEYVRTIVEFAKLPCRVEPGPAFSRLAPVSHNEAGVNYRLQLMGLDAMPGWREALQRYVMSIVPGL